MKIVKLLDEKLEETIIILLLIALSCAMMYSVVMRYVFGKAPIWTEEFCRYCYIWQVALSLSYCTLKDNAMKVTVAMDLLPDKLHNVIKVLVYAAEFVAFAVFGVQSIAVVQQQIQSGAFSTALHVPMQFMYMSFTIGFFLACIRCIQRIIYTVKHFNDKLLSTTEQAMADAQAEADLAAKDLASANAKTAGGGKA